MMLLVLLVLAAVPLLGVGWILFYGSPTTVDGLFTALILLAMSGILGTTALFELRKGKAAFSGPKGSSRRSGTTLAGDAIRHGKVEDVVFFEAHVGQPNKSIVTLSDGDGPWQTLVLEGDVRNALPVGQTLEIRLRKEPGRSVLVEVSHS